MDEVAATLQEPTFYPNPIVTQAYHNKSPAAATQSV